MSPEYPKDPGFTWTCSSLKRWNALPKSKLLKKTLVTFQLDPSGACGRTLVKLNKKTPLEGEENVWVRFEIGAEGERIDTILEPVTLTPWVSFTLTWSVSPGTQKSVGTPPRVVWTDSSALAPVARSTAVPLNQG